MTEEAIPTSPSPEATSPPLPAPTYSAEPMGERTVYTCLIPDAGHEDGICGHKTTDEGYMTMHMQQRHSGVMIQAPATMQEPGAGVEAVSADAAPSTGTSTSSPTSPRTAEQAEHPAQVPPSPPTPEPTPQTSAEAEE